MCVSLSVHLGGCKCVFELNIVKYLELPYKLEKPCRPNLGKCQYWQDVVVADSGAICQVQIQITYI